MLDVMLTDVRSCQMLHVVLIDVSKYYMSARKNTLHGFKEMGILSFSLQLS